MITSDNMKKKIRIIVICFLLMSITGCINEKTVDHKTKTDQIFLNAVAPAPTSFSIENDEKSKLIEQNNLKTDQTLPHNAVNNKTEAAEWVQNHFTEYYQKYNLSCEAALIRLIAGLWGVDELTEDDILDMMPLHPSNPEAGLVIENIQGSVYHEDGSINWANYGAHPPVVKQTLEMILEKYRIDSFYEIMQQRLDNRQLIDYLKTESSCIGAIIWVAAYIDDEKPPVNEIGQVLGEHVQYVSPVLDSKGRMLVYDVWPWQNQPFHLLRPFNRDMFSYETLLIMTTNN